MGAGEVSTGDGAQTGAGVSWLLGLSLLSAAGCKGFPALLGVGKSSCFIRAVKTLAMIGGAEECLFGCFLMEGRKKGSSLPLIYIL